MDDEYEYIPKHEPELIDYNIDDFFTMGYGTNISGYENYEIIEELPWDSTG